jgi:hypothetical protein
VTNAVAKMCPVCPEELGQETLVEPEIDGDLLYWECQECYYTWGWTKVEDNLKPVDSCALGISPELRKAAGKVSGAPVDLGISIGLRPGL